MKSLFNCGDKGERNVIDLSTLNDVYEEDITPAYSAKEYDVLNPSSSSSSSSSSSKSSSSSSSPASSRGGKKDKDKDKGKKGVGHVNAGIMTTDEDDALPSYEDVTSGAVPMIVVEHVQVEDSHIPDNIPDNHADSAEGVGKPGIPSDQLNGHFVQVHMQPVEEDCEVVNTDTSIDIKKMMITAM